MSGSNIIHDGHSSVILQSSNGDSVELTELVNAVRELNMLQEFIENSSLSEEYKEFRVFHKLKD